MAPSATGGGEDAPSAVATPDTKRKTKRLRNNLCMVLSLVKGLGIASQFGASCPPRSIRRSDASPAVFCRLRNRKGLHQIDFTWRKLRLRRVRAPDQLHRKDYDRGEGMGCFLVGG